MAIFDWIIISILGVSVLMSIRRGFLKEALSLATWIAAVIVARLFSGHLFVLLEGQIETASLRLGASYLMLFVGTLVVGGVVNFAMGEFVTAGFIMLAGNIFDFIDGKVAEATNTKSDFGGFWDSVMDRFSDLSLFVGVMFLYAELGRTDYVMIAAFAMMFSVMTSYTRARAESMIEKCKVGFMERPERIVLVMIGAFTNRMGAVLWVILVLSVVTVIDRIYFTWRTLKTEGPFSA